MKKILHSFFCAGPTVFIVVGLFLYINMGSSIAVWGIAAMGIFLHICNQLSMKNFTEYTNDLHEQHEILLQVIEDMSQTIMKQATNTEENSNG